MKFEKVPIKELRTRIPAELLPMVEDCKNYLRGLSETEGGRLILEKSDDPKKARRALKVAASSMDETKTLVFPYRGEEGTVTFYLEKKRGRRAKAEVSEEPTLTKPGVKRRGMRKKAG